MALTFPTNPTLNQEYVYGAVPYIWNGVAWTKKTTATTSLSEVFYNSNTGVLETSSGTTIQVNSSKDPNIVTRTVSTNTTILASDATYIVGVSTSSNPVTINFPSNPSTGFTFSLVDVSSAWGVNPVTVTGAKISGLSQDLVLDITGVKVTFAYVDATVGWTFMTSSGAQMSAILASPAMTGTPTVNSLPVVVFDPAKSAYVVGGTTITKMSSPSTIQYDSQGRVKSYTSEGDTYTITYDSGGRVISVTNGSETNTVLYDGANRVIGVTLS